MERMKPVSTDEVMIPMGTVILPGILQVPEAAVGMVIFSHGSGSSRFSSRNRMVARFLQERNIATLLFDLLSEEEDQDYDNRFDIGLLTGRLAGATRWAIRQTGLPFGFFGASTGAASALKAAAALPETKAVVSRGGRPDLAMDDLPAVQAPTLLIVGSLDEEVLKLNSHAYAQLSCEKAIEIVQGATHLFEEPGKMEEVCELAAIWFSKYLGKHAG